MKNSTYTRITLLLTALLTLAGCREELGVNLLTPGSEGIVATIAQEDPKTRTQAIDTPGRGIRNIWQAGDAIGLLDAQGGNARFSVATEDITSGGREAIFRGEAGIPAGQLMAYYPYQAGATRQGEGFVQLDLPARQLAIPDVESLGPDPRALIMVASGSQNAGLSFRNVTALLKFSYIFGEEVTITDIAFTDLSGTPVAGRATVAWNGGSPELTVTGSEAAIHLDCGDGIAVKSTQAHPFFLSVPAREYPKGFQITYTLSDGRKVEKTIGTKMGKRLLRSTVYPLGEESRVEQMDNEYKLYPGARMMDARNMELIRVISCNSGVHLYYADGTPAKDCYGDFMYGMEMKLLVHKDLEPVKGGWLIFNEPSELLPKGAVMRIDECYPSNDDEHYFVHAQSDPNPFAPFESAQVGEPVFDEEGKVKMESGMEMDGTRHLSRILDADGNEVPFHITPDGRIGFDEDVINRYSLEEETGKPATRSVVSKTVSLPNATHTFDHPDSCLSVTVGAQMTLGLRFGMGAVSGSLQWMNLPVNLVVEFPVTFSAAKKLQFSKSVRLWTFYFYFPTTPVITSEVGFYLGFNAEMSLELSATLKYQKDFGIYGFSYNRGDGFIGRHTDPVSSEGDGDASISDKLKAEGDLGFSVAAGLSLTTRAMMGIAGLLSAGMDVEAGLWFGGSAGFATSKLSLYPKLSVTPVTATLGGYYSQKWENLKTEFELDPVWERHILPQVGYSVKWYYGWSDGWTEFTVPERITSQVPVKRTAVVSVKAKGPSLFPMDVFVNEYHGTAYWDVFPSMPQNVEHPYSDFAAAGIPWLYSVMTSSHCRVENPTLAGTTSLLSCGSDTESLEASLTFDLSLDFSEGYAYSFTQKSPIGTFESVLFIPASMNTYYVSDMGEQVPGKPMVLRRDQDGAAK